MSAALDALRQRIAELDERDDQIVDLVNDLKSQVAALQEQVSGADTEIQATADQIVETIGKLDGALSPVDPKEPVEERSQYNIENRLG